MGVRRATSLGAGWRSIGLPNTSNMRDRMVLLTGVRNGPPLSLTAIPRANPCVGVSAMQRTCCASRSGFRFRR